MVGLYSIPLGFLLALGSGHQPENVSGHRSDEFIRVEIILGKEKTLHRYKVPVVPNPRDRKPIDNQWKGGGYISTGGCPDDIGCDYFIIITADAASPDAAKVTVNLKVSLKSGRGCEVSQEFLVNRGKISERKMRCRAAKADVRLSYFT